MTSKTKLPPQVKNGKKNAFWDFMVSRVRLSETKTLFCKDHGIKMVSSWGQVGLKTVQTSI